MPAAAQERFDVIVLGAGAAGLFCAATAGARGLRVAVIEHSEAPGRKILISGGGRCNFTNTGCRAENFLSENPHFAHSALAGYTAADFVALVERYGIAYHEKELGQLFCDRSARDILSMLLAECETAHVQLQMRTRIDNVTHNGSFAVHTQRDGRAQVLSARAVVVATGGLSIPKAGATGFAYDLARQFGLRIVAPRPGLVPLELDTAQLDNAQHAPSTLAGVSLEAIVAVEKASFRHKLLFTHRGISGPAVLQASSYWRPGGTVRIDLLPGVEVTAQLRAGPAARTPAALQAAMRNVLPARFADEYLSADAPSGWSDRELKNFDNALHNWTFVPTDTAGFAKAEVTVGGVSTADLNAGTLESRICAGLYFIGEAVDVTGWLGGYNFQWAWSSGAAAGRAILS